MGLGDAANFLALDMMFYITNKPETGLKYLRKLSLWICDGHLSDGSGYGQILVVAKSDEEAADEAISSGGIEACVVVPAAPLSYHMRKFNYQDDEYYDTVYSRELVVELGRIKMERTYQDALVVANWGNLSGMWFTSIL